MRHALHRFTAAEKIAGDVGSQHAVNTFSGEVFNGGLFKQNSGVVHQCGERLTFAIEAGEHRHHLRFIADVRAHGKGFTARVHDLINDLCRGFDVVMKIHRNGVAFACQL